MVLTGKRAQAEINKKYVLKLSECYGWEAGRRRYLPYWSNGCFSVMDKKGGRGGGGVGGAWSINNPTPRNS